MTLMPSPHVRDPRRRYRANKIRKGQGTVPPPVVVVPETLVKELVLATPQVRTRALQRIEQERGTAYVSLVITAVAAALREGRP